METVDAPAAARPRPRPKWHKPVFTAAFVAFIGVWIFGFWYTANRPAPEPLDAASIRSAVTMCRAAISELSTFGPIAAPTDIAGRVARVRRENAVLEDLVAGLRTIHPPDGDGATAIAAFTTDWQHLTAARESYAETLTTATERPDLVVPVGPDKAPVTIRMRQYAEIHRLNACTPDALQGEVVEGVRTYPRVP